MTHDDEEAVLAQAEEIRARRAERYRLDADIVENRAKNLWNGFIGQRYAPEDLCFSATARCGCGAGLAYPKKSGMHGSWHCSAILLGAADKTQTHDKLPFAFYEIKSENQPSANGATTRPKET